MQVQISQKFEDNIKRFVIIDNKIKSAKMAIKELEKEKKDASNNILIYIKTNSLEEAPINITGGRIKYFVSKSTSPMSKKYIQDRLEQYFKSKSKAEEIIDFLYSNRETTEYETIKRTIVKN